MPIIPGWKVRMFYANGAVTDPMGKLSRSPGVGFVIAVVVNG